MLKTIRIILALFSIIAVTLLFIDFTGTAAAIWSWMAKIQLIPALLSVNIVALFIILAGTLIFGRIYCSIICPLGIFQDVVNWVRGHIGTTSKRKNRFFFSPAWTKTRLIILTVFSIFLILGLTSVLASAFAGLIEPYSAYGRVASQIFAPAWDGINNLLANWSESQEGNYWFYRVACAVSVPVLIVAIVTLLAIVVFAWRGGRDYCNTICPVGTILGYIAQFSLLKPVIEKDKCIRCGKCGRNCKAKCIDTQNHRIDYTRCIDCMDCISVCQEGAINYSLFKSKSSDASNNKVAKKTSKVTDLKTPNSRRGFLIAGATLAGTAVMNAVTRTDGGLTVLKKKQSPHRETPIAAAGAQSLKHLRQHCTGCQLCIQACPHDVLSANMSLDGFMQPVVDYTNGFCHTDCTVCSHICPVGAYHPITEEEKSSIKVGTAVVNLDTCLSATGENECGNCARHCPAGAITMVPVIEGKEELMPVVNDSICIGCGACEYYCPVGTVASMKATNAAIHVEGIEIHREI